MKCFQPGSKDGSIHLAGLRIEGLNNNSTTNTKGGATGNNTEIRGESREIAGTNRSHNSMGGEAVLGTAETTKRPWTTARISWNT